MRIFRMAGIGLSGLLGSPFRAAMTFLGVVIGVFAVVFLPLATGDAGSTNLEAKEGNTSTISAEGDVATLINVFTVKPEDQQRLVDVLAEAAPTMKTIPGYVSSNIHKSLDGTRVVNYVQWESVKDFEAMLGNPEAAPHMREAAEIAEKYEPLFYEVSSVNKVADDEAGR